MKLDTKIESKRRRMNRAINCFGVKSKQALKASEELNNLIVLKYKGELA